MILCKFCNAVRHNTPQPCWKCSRVMGISERSAASLHIPERQFFENVLRELNDARRQFPDTHGLISSMSLYAGHVKAAAHENTSDEFRLRLLKLTAICFRLWVEGERTFPITLPTSDDPLSELETQLKGL